MVPVVLADDLLAVELPQPRVVIRAGCHQVRRVSAEGAVPDPALVARQGCLKRIRPRLLVWGGLDVLDLPDLGRVVSATGCKLLDVRGEEDARDVLLVGAEVRHRDELGAVEALDKVPHKDIALDKSVSFGEEDC